MIRDVIGTTLSSQIDRISSSGVFIGLHDLTFWFARGSSCLTLGRDLNEYQGDRGER